MLVSWTLVLVFGVGDFHFGRVKNVFKNCCPRPKNFLGRGQVTKPRNKNFLFRGESYGTTNSNFLGSCSVIEKYYITYVFFRSPI